MKTFVLSILILLVTVAYVSIGNSYYVYNLATDMIRETDVVFEKGFRTTLTLEEYMENEFRNLQVAEIHRNKPTFSWMIHSSKQNTFQRKYRIIVASSKAWIDKNEGDIWDSGLVMDSSSVAVDYAGPTLKPGTLYYWKVAIVDSKGRKSGFSEAKGFITASELDDYTSVLTLEKRTQQPANIVARGQSVLVDFGKDAFGQLSLKLNSLSGQDTVIVHLGEDLDSSGMVNQKPSGAVRYKRYVLDLNSGYLRYNIEFAPDHVNTNPSIYNGALPVLMPEYIGEVLPFRYVQIDNYKHQPVYSNITRIAVNYPFDDEAADFNCDDTLLNQIWELCKHTMKATSFTGFFVDGDRERITYEADVYINQLSYFAVSDQYSIARNTLERLMFNSTWPTEWVLQTAMIAYDYYLYSGDITFLKKYYEHLKMRTLYEYANDYDHLLHSGDGIDDPYFLTRINCPTPSLNDIVDWPQSERDMYGFKYCNTAVNSFFYKALTVFSKIAAAVDNNYDAFCFNDYASNARDSINGIMLQPGGLYCDAIDTTHTSLHANMLPLALGVADPKSYGQLLPFIKTRGMACSPYGAQFLLDAVYEAGDPDYALQLMTDTSERSWYQMIRRGCTMTTEAWNDSIKPNQDWNHAWGAAPANIISRHLMGIQPVEPGFARVRIAPQTGRLAHAYIKHPTPRGAIVVEVRSEGNSKKLLTADIPPNMTADIVLPDGSVRTVGSGSWKFTTNTL